MLFVRDVLKLELSAYLTSFFFNRSHWQLMLYVLAGYLLNDLHTHFALVDLPVIKFDLVPLLTGS